MALHCRRPPAAPRVAVLAAAVVTAAVVLAGCAAGSPYPVVSFDPTGPCTTDGRMPGAFPELETWLPTTFLGQAPANVDSGRSCSADALGALAGHGIDELRFAGATWDLGSGAAATVAVFSAAGLTPEQMIEFYAAGARANRKTERLVTSDPTVGGVAARRLDVLQSDGTGQTIVAWPTGEEGLVRVLLAADLGDTRVLEALEQLAVR